MRLEVDLRPVQGQHDGGKVLTARMLIVTCQNNSEGCGQLSL